MGRFVTPAVVRIPLPGPPDGDCIEVKKELTVGDQKRLEAAGMRRVQKPRPDGSLAYELEIDWETFELARAEVWLTDWSGPSFIDTNGQPIRLTFAALRALTPDAFDQISAAIKGHVEAIEQEKKLKATASARPAGTPA